MFGQPYVHAWMRSLKLWKESCENALHRLGSGPDAQDASAAAAEASGPFDERLRLSEHMPTYPQKVVSFRGELKTAADAVEETHLEFRLEVANLPRECRLANVHTERRFRNARRFGNADKVAEVPPLIAPGIRAS